MSASKSNEVGISGFMVYHPETGMVVALEDLMVFHLDDLGEEDVAAIEAGEVPEILDLISSDLAEFLNHEDDDDGFSDGE